MSGKENNQKKHYAMAMITGFIVVSAIAIISVVGVTLDSLKVAIENDRAESFSNLSSQSSEFLDDTINSTKEYSKLFAESFGSDYDADEDMYEYFQNKTKGLEIENSVLILVDSNENECYTSTGHFYTIQDADNEALAKGNTVIIEYLMGPPDPKYMIFLNKLNSPVYANYQGEKVRITHTAVALSMDYVISKMDSYVPADVDSYIVNGENEVVCSRIITDTGINGNEFFTDSFKNDIVKAEDRESFADKIDSGEPFTYEFFYKGKEYTVGISKINGMDMWYVAIIESDALGTSVESALYRIITLCTVIVCLLGFSLFFITFYFKKSKIDKQLLEEKEEIQDKLENNLKIVAMQKSELEKQQNALEEALKMAKSSSRAKTTFLSNMSHDIRTPMNAIMGYTTLATANIDNTDKVKDYLEKIESSSSHLLSLINEILDMSSIESGLIEINPAEEKLSEIIKTVTNLLDSEADKKKQKFIVEQDVIHDKVKCDKLRLEQVLLNITTNSIQYTNDGGTIKLVITEKNETAGKSEFVFEIMDNGVGMSEEFISTIFDPFTRVNSSTISGVDGTGLGMAIAGKIIDKMGGICKVESRENVGTKVTINFEFEISEEKGPEENDCLKLDFSGKRALIVEDNVLNAEIAEEILTEHGFVTDKAEDGSVAVEMVKEAPFGTYDVILMDIQMPIMDGYEATRTIRALEDENKCNIPIIAMTANAFDEDVKMAFEAGMNNHVAKPVNIRVLLNALKGVLL